MLLEQGPAQKKHGRGLLLYNDCHLNQQRKWGLGKVNREERGQSLTQVVGVESLELGRQDEKQGSSEHQGIEQSPPALDGSFLHAEQTAGEQTGEPPPPFPAAVAHTHVPSSSTPGRVSNVIWQLWGTLDNGHPPNWANWAKNGDWKHPGILVSRGKNLHCLMEFFQS